jgi:hypothetical protein
MQSENSKTSSDPVIAILTCDRPSGFYLGETVRQIQKEGGCDFRRSIYVDGTEQFVDSLQSRLRPYGINDWEIIQLGERLGSTEAMRRVIAQLAKLNSDLLFFEDDLILCRNAVRRMACQQVPDDVGIVTFFDMKEVTPGAAPGLHRRPPNGKNGNGFWGAQCLRIHHEFIQWMAHKNWNDSKGDGDHMASDILMGRLMAEHPKRNNLAVHIPNLVEHAGHASACFPGLSLSPRWRRASNFLGREFDAMSLASMM